MKTLTILPLDAKDLKIAAISIEQQQKITGGNDDPSLPIDPLPIVGHEDIVEL